MATALTGGLGVSLDVLKPTQSTLCGRCRISRRGDELSLYRAAWQFGQPVRQSGGCLHKLTLKARKRPHSLLRPMRGGRAVLESEGVLWGALIGFWGLRDGGVERAPRACESHAPRRVWSRAAGVGRRR